MWTPKQVEELEAKYGGNWKPYTFAELEAMYGKSGALVVMQMRNQSAK